MQSEKASKSHLGGYDCKVKLYRCSRAPEYIARVNSIFKEIVSQGKTRVLVEIEGNSLESCIDVVREIFERYIMLTLVVEESRGTSELHPDSQISRLEVYWECH